MVVACCLVGLLRVLFVVCRVLFAVCCVLCVVVRCLQFVVYCSLYADRCWKLLLSVVGCLLFVACSL